MDLNLGPGRVSMWSPYIHMHLELDLAWLYPNLGPALDGICPWELLVCLALVGPGPKENYFVRCPKVSSRLQRLSKSAVVLGMFT